MVYDLRGTMAEIKEIRLGEKEEQRRQMILNGEMYKTILYISAPVAFYNLINQFLTFFNSVIVADLGKDIFSMVSYVNSIQFMLTSLGAGLSIGGGILIAKHYGEGDFNKTKEYIVNLNLFAFFVCGLLLIATIPFAEVILRLATVPENMISIGAIYFRIEVLSVVCMFINQIYITIERARGNTKKIMVLNFVVIGLKLTLTYIFVKVMNFEVISVAVSTLIAQITLTIVALKHMLLEKKNPFKMDLASARVDLSIAKKIFTMSFPIIFEKIAFSFGKVYVNTLGSHYSPTAVGALGVSNQMGGMITTVAQGFQSGETTVISQNIGNKNIKRALDGFKATLVINLVYSLLSLVIAYLYMDQLIGLYAKNDMAFASEIKIIFQLEMLATITVSLSTTVLGLLYGFGHTTIALIINMMRIFVFRIPVVLFFVKYTSVGVEALGYSMFISNAMVGVVAIIFAYFIIKDIKAKNNIEYKVLSKVRY